MCLVVKRARWLGQANVQRKLAPVAPSILHQLPFVHLELELLLSPREALLYHINTPPLAPTPRDI